MDIRWTVKDIQGREIILKQTTYDEHITEDHDLQDAKFRKSMEPRVKQTLISPDVIIKDGKRNLYYNTVVIRHEEGLPKVKILKVVVDADRIPNEVITWTPLRKGDAIRNGVIFYERGTIDLSDKQVR